MNKTLISLFTAAVTLLSSNAAFCGAQENGGVTITNNSGTIYAEGVMSSTRTTGNSTEYIGCYAMGDSTNASAIICEAKNSVGVYQSCIIPNPSAKLLALVGAINPSSKIKFKWASGSGCDWIAITVGSNYL